MAGDLIMLQWARGQGCPWDQRTCVEAARHGHLEVLKYARQEGCPWDTEGYRAAQHPGYPADVVQYLEENGCPREH